LDRKIGSKEPENRPKLFTGIGSSKNILETNGILSMMKQVNCCPVHELSIPHSDKYPRRGKKLKKNLPGNECIMKIASTLKG
jgi:hypothetical protein